MAGPVNPFWLPPQSVISFSGGRTSGLMLRGIIDAHGGTLPADRLVCFQNTGKEREETLDFVRDCAERWSLDIRWLEYRREGAAHGFHVVSHATAARHGEPFEALIGKLADYRAGNGQPPVLPNPVQRFCTAELKIRTVKRYVQSRGWPIRETTMAIGFRADEPHRAARMRRRVDAGDFENGDPVFPLVAAGVTVGDVTRFWQAQPFDLRLEPHEGNCDLCFLKKGCKMTDLLRRYPEKAAWWIRMEQQTGQRFRDDRPSYAGLLRQAQDQGTFDWGDEPDEGGCFCTD
jgi:3'-phosphoadenosine 5'-phosphosulfate sulfotransferase (PAPS reductase)/FAD synthetase